MNKKYLIPVAACILIFSILFSTTMPVLAVTRAVIGPKLVVTTIPQDDQKREKGIIVLGLDEPDNWPKPYDEGSDFLSQHKLLVTYNGQTLLWRTSGPLPGEYAEPVVTCNVLEKDKVNPIDDKDGIPTEQFPAENLVTKLIDVSEKFKCKPRWKEPANMPGWRESVGVLDVYFLLPTTANPAQWIADHILTVNVTLVLGRTIIVGTDIQDICVLGFSMAENSKYITKPDHGELHWTWDDALGPFAGCEEAAIWQRYYLGLEIEGVVQE